MRKEEPEKDLNIAAKIGGKQKLYFHPFNHPSNAKVSRRLVL